MEGIHNVVLDGILRHTSTNTVETFLMQHFQSLSLTAGLIEGVVSNERLGKGSLEAILNLNPSLHGAENIAGELLDACTSTYLGVDYVINKCSWTSYAAILFVCRVGKETCVRVLMDSGALLYCENGHLPRALTYASEQGDEAMIGLMLSRGVDCHFQTPRGETSLTLASRQGHEKVVQLLLDGGADPNEKIGQDEPLLQAAAMDMKPWYSCFLIDERISKYETAAVKHQSLKHACWQVRAYVSFC